MIGAAEATSGHRQACTHGVLHAYGLGCLCAPARLVALMRGMGARRIQCRAVVASRWRRLLDVLLAAHARATQVPPDGPLLAIGGDCGADLGPAAQALRRHDGELAILWIDAHADFNTPASSLSGAFHGMVLRSLTGIGPEGLTALVSALPSSLVLAGTRSIDAAEQHQLAAAGVEPLGMRALAHLPPPPPPGTRPRRLITPPAGWSWLPVA